MPPAIPEVVLVLEGKPPAALGQDVAELRGGRVLVRHLVQHRVVPIMLAVDPEVVQMAVGPAHRRLDVFVQLVEGAVLDLDAPPDRRARIEQGDLELVKGDSLQCGNNLLVHRTALLGEQRGRVLVAAPTPSLAVGDTRPPTPHCVPGNSRSLPTLSANRCSAASALDATVATFRTASSA